MTLLILALFIALPIAEIAVLIKVADIIDLMPTIMLIILTAIVGVYLLRQQGLSSLARAQTSLNEGRVPVDSLTDAVGLMVAGAFLLTPGLITDSVGFALLIPPVRHGLARYLFNKARRSDQVRVDIFGMEQHTYRQDDPFSSGKSGPSEHSGPIIEGEIIEPTEPATHKGSGTKGPKNGKPEGKSPWNR